MSDVVFYKTPDDLSIELIIEKSENSKGIILVWPCTMGDVRMYKVPTDILAEKGYTSILFNPRGHGNSGGQFDIPDAINDLASFVSEFNKEKLPLISVGHSGGCAGLLNIGMRLETKKYFLAAPVLDSRKSLFHMYSNNSINEFNMMISSSSPDQKFVLSILETDEWLDPEYWRVNDLKEQLDAVSGEFKIGRFLDKLFIDGISGYKELEAQSNIAELLLPSVDKWYPLDSTRKFAKKHQIPIKDNFDAHDHYFTKGWKNVWAYILSNV